MCALRVELTAPQYEFVTSPEPFPAFVGGFGSGKTHGGIARLIAKKLQYPRQNVAYYLPTYDLVRTTGFPRFEEFLDQIAVRHKINRSDNVIDFHGMGRLIFRTMDQPQRIVSYEVADSLVDELDTLPIDKARDAWNKVLGRNRQKKPDGSLNTVGVATTPEGFRFVYERWKKQPAVGYVLIKASTYSNAHNLPPGYIDSLIASYPSNLVAAYIDGEFVNLTSGSVYPDFHRTLNASSESIRPGEPLHIGMDFNVTHGAAAIHVLRGDEPHAVAEVTDAFDTPAMIRILQDRYRGHPLLIYPDAAGKARKSNNASESDIALLRQAGMTVLVNASNPRVKDRVLAVNAMIHKADVRRYRVNPEHCPHLVESLEKQAYDKSGEPDKSNGLDHIVDAAGYFLVYRYPVASRAISVTTYHV